MDNTVNTFKTQQDQALELLNRLQQFLIHGEEAGVDIESTLKTKLQTAIASVSNDKLKVALIGGFSEGKTSIAAAWMEKIDRSSMKISHEESSNEVKIYEVGNDLLLIDTPGLFGFKEQTNFATNEIEKYKDITRKYVSEAHLVLYVMNPTNPIKESHKEELEWMFRTLDLLPRTVFVLSRFDEIADVEDEDDYQENLKIKRDNVSSRLKDLINLDEREIEDLSIVAVAANPFDLGVDHWLNNLEQFKAFSHIDKLQTATKEKIQQSGGNMALINDMRMSVIHDVLSKQLPIAIENESKISEEVEKLDDVIERVHSQKIDTNQQINQARISLREFATNYFTDLILQAQGTTLETFAEFFEREIGSEGVIIESRLQNEFSKRTEVISVEIEKMEVDFNNEVSHFNELVSSLGKQGINQVLKGNYINNTTVIAMRDGAVTIAKTVGLDIAKYLKFKPYGAVNMAKGLNGALIAVGVLMEAWDSWKSYQREEVFSKHIKKMVSDFDTQRKEFIGLVNSPTFVEDFFPNYISLCKNQEELELDLTKRKQKQHLFEAWRKDAEDISFILKN